MKIILKDLKHFSGKYGEKSKDSVVFFLHSLRNHPNVLGCKTDVCHPAVEQCVEKRLEWISLYTGGKYIFDTLPILTVFPPTKNSEGIKYLFSPPNVSYLKLTKSP